MKFGLCLLALILSAQLAANDPVQLPGCVAPERPPKTDPIRWDAFVDAVNAYRHCINAYQARQYAQADAHRAAAEGAVQAWNDFVRENLNVPEDFPHLPPEGKQPAAERSTLDR